MPTIPGPSFTFDLGGTEASKPTGKVVTVRKIPVVWGRQLWPGDDDVEAWLGDKCINTGEQNTIPDDWSDGTDDDDDKFDHIRVPEDFKGELPDWAEMEPLSHILRSHTFLRNHLNRDRLYIIEPCRY